MRMWMDWPNYLSRILKRKWQHTQSARSSTIPNLTTRAAGIGDPQPHRPAEGSLHSLAAEPAPFALHQCALPLSAPPGPGPQESGLWRPGDRTHQSLRPDRFKAKVGVRRVPFRFMTAFVTWRHEFSGWPEQRRNEGCAIEPSCLFTF